MKLPPVVHLKCLKDCYVSNIVGLDPSALLWCIIKSFFDWESINKHHTGLLGSNLDTPKMFVTMIFLMQHPKEHRCGLDES